MLNACRTARFTSPYGPVLAVLLPLLGCGCAGDDASQPFLDAGKDKPPDHAPCVLTRVATLPYELNDGHFIIGGKIDGSAASLLFDTGAATTVLTPSAVKRFNLSHEYNQMGVMEGVGGATRVSEYRARSLGFGDLHGGTWRFLVGDLNLDKLKPPAPDGLLGSDILWTYDIDLDTPDHQIILYYPLHDCSKPSVFLHTNLYTVPLIKPYEPAVDPKSPLWMKAFFALSPPVDSTPKIMVSINGHDLRAELDTGAPNTVLFANGADILGLKPKDVKAEPRIDEAGIGPNMVPAFRHIVPPIQIGDLEIDNLPVALLMQ